MIKAIIFDLNGVLVDTEEVHFQAHKKVLSNYGIDLTMDEYAQHGIGSKTYDFHIYLRGKYNTLFDVYQSEVEKRNLFRAMISSGVKLMPNVKESLIALQDKYTLAVASTAPLTSVKRLLERTNIYEYFKIVVSGEEVDRNKPNPEIYNKALEKLKVKAGECIALEDTVLGLESARSAGLRCVVIPNRISKVQDFSDADLVLNSINELNEDIIKKLGK